MVRVRYPKLFVDFSKRSRVESAGGTLQFAGERSAFALEPGPLEAVVRDRKIRLFLSSVSAMSSPAMGAEVSEGVEGFGRPEDVYSKAGVGQNAGL